MSSREKILSAVSANQPELARLPKLSALRRDVPGSLEKFGTMLKSVGGSIYHVHNYDEVIKILKSSHGEKKKIISAFSEIGAHYDEHVLESPKISDLSEIDIAILKGRFGVAENGAVWLTDQEMRRRALPFICQHLAIVVQSDSIVPTMHEAYNLIGKTTYGFGTFIAGPSKTADIEQSLVIGAHGPRSMAVFLLFNDTNH